MARWQRDAAKERVWRRHVAAWRRSGLSVRDYCSAAGLAEANFYAWRRTLSEREQQKRCRPPAALPAFVPVEVVSDEATSTWRGSVEVVLGNGQVLRVGADFDAQVVRRLLALLEEPAC